LAGPLGVIFLSFCSTLELSFVFVFHIK